MAFKIATGRKFNLLERCAAAPTVTPAADARFPVTNAYDGYPDQPFMFGSIATTATYLIDLNEITDGDMETVFDATTTLPTSAWGKKGAPTVTRVTGAGNFNSGTAGCRVVGTAGTDYIYFDAPFLTDEGGHFTVSSRRGTNVGENSNVYVQNLQNGKYLTNAAVWTLTKTAFQNITGTAFVTTASDFTIEPFSSCGDKHAIMLRIILDGGGAAASGPIYDDVYIWPGVSLASIHGHNLGGATPSGSAKQPSFYSAFALVQSDRYWAFQYEPAGGAGQAIRMYSGTTTSPATSRGAFNANNPFEPLWYGELVLAQTFTLTKEPNTPVSYRFVQPQLRSTADRIAYARSSGPTRILGCSFRYSSLAMFQQARDEIYRRSLGGVYAAVVIPNDSDTEVCIYGRLVDDWGYDLTLVTYFTGSTLVWTELPLPTFLP